VVPRVHPRAGVDVDVELLEREVGQVRVDVARGVLVTDPAEVDAALEREAPQRQVPQVDKGVARRAERRRATTTQPGRDVFAEQLVLAARDRAGARQRAKRVVAAAGEEADGRDGVAQPTVETV
jgi:hypothetical protein